MNHTPILLLVGQAGSGKDTVAGFLAKNHNAIMVAQADPMKRLARIIFNFSMDQLWGPSSSRNAVDDSYSLMELDDEMNVLALSDKWTRAMDQLRSKEVAEWLRDVCGDLDIADVRSKLDRWLMYVKASTFNAGKPLTPRYVLQTMGTEWGRAVDKNLWTNYVNRIAFKLLGGGFKYSRDVGLISDEGYKGPDWVVITDGRFRNEIINVLEAGGQVIRVDSPDTDGSAVEAAGVKGHASEAEQKGVPYHFFTGFFWNDKALGLEGCEQNVRRLVGAIQRGYVFMAGKDHPWFIPSSSSSGGCVNTP